jgi:hypothetical protein
MTRTLYLLTALSACATAPAESVTISHGSEVVECVEGFAEVAVPAGSVWQAHECVDAAGDDCLSVSRANSQGGVVVVGCSNPSFVRVTWIAPL